MTDAGPYFLFAGENYYASGGMDDYVNTFATLEAAEAWLQENRDPGDVWANAATVRAGRLVQVCYWRAKECPRRLVVLPSGRQYWNTIDGWQRIEVKPEEVASSRAG